MNIFNQVPIRTVLHALGVDLGSEQSQHIQCLNPMHNDKTASAYINEHTIHCFGCNTTYNAMGLIKVVLNVDDENARDWYTRNVLHNEIPNNSDAPRKRLPSFKPTHQQPTLVQSASINQPAQSSCFSSRGRAVC